MMIISTTLLNSKYFVQNITIVRKKRICIRRNQYKNIKKFQGEINLKSAESNKNKIDSIVKSPYHNRF